MQYVSSSEMAQVDELAVNKYNISLLQMMEHAGWNLAKLAVPFIKPDSTVQIFAGKGNNGGGGLCAARHLKNRGYDVRVHLAYDKENGASVKHHLKTLWEMNVPVKAWSKDKFGQDDLVIDALLGYNIKGDPRPPIDKMITWVNNTGNRVLSLDIPSGLNPDTGKPGNPCIKATATLTLALPKLGFKEETAKEYFGWMYLGDIGIPLELYHELGIEAGYLFNNEKIVRIG